MFGICAISGRTDDGLPISGVAVADMSGDGNVTVSTSGKECQDAYYSIQ